MTDNAQKHTLMQKGKPLTAACHQSVFASWLRVFSLVFILTLASSSQIFAQQRSAEQAQQKSKDPDQPNVDGLVEVSFKVDASGQIQIVHINSTSTQLTEYVVKKLTKIKLNTPTGSDGKVITYRFVFKKQA